MTHYGFLSTFPPTRCGLATFTESLSDALVLDGDEEGTIVRVLDQPEDRGPHDPRVRSRVRTDLIADDRLSRMRATLALNACDVAIVQHEYGIYGGPDGDQVLEVLAALKIPAIVVLHTVLVAPTPHQREVLTEVCRLASVVIVMTAHARDNLAAHYAVDLAHVHVIPHGVHVAVREPDSHSGRRVVTWGLLSPGKGVEWGIRAMAQLADVTPPVEYIVAGQTHPKVLAHAGESYRTMLAALSGELGIEASVRIQGHYLDAHELAALIASADAVLLPYDSVDQATSGVLAEAVAAGIPVVATGFPHAVELLSTGAGTVVPHRDPDAIAQALREILTGSSVADHMREAALRETNETTWSAVADRYRALTTRLVAARAA